MIRIFLFLLLSLLLFVPLSLSDERSPEKFTCLFEFTHTTEGKEYNFTLYVTRKWAPLGVDRFYTLVKDVHYFDDSSFFRVLPGFVVQFGIAGDPALSKKWQNLNIKDDPVVESNTRGRIAFATAGPNTRTTQLFINYGNNSRLDALGFAPFGEVTAEEDLSILDKIFSGYEQQPDQEQIYARGNAYLKEKYPKLDYIKRVTITTEDK